MGAWDFFTKSWHYDEHNPENRRVKGGLWSENTGSKADRQRVVRARADKANKTLQAKLAKDAKAMQAKAQRKAAADKKAGEKKEAARRAKYVKEHGSKKGGWW
jgi:hypothetical protein